MQEYKDAKSFEAGNVRTHKAAMIPQTQTAACGLPSANSLNGTILTGEMFAPILCEQVEKLNQTFNSNLKVIAVPNTYFGGDVSVAGLLTGQDFLAIKDKVEGDFVIIPKHTIKSDEPILLDGMQFDYLKSQFAVPIYNLDIEEFIGLFI